MKKTLLTSLLCVAMAATLMAGCGSKAESKDSKKPEKKSSVETTVDVESATASQVEEFLSDSDDNTMLVDEMCIRDRFRRCLRKRLRWISG